MGDDADTSTPLKIGDYVSVRRDEELGGEFYLDAEGILEDHVTASQHADAMDDRIFQICVRTRVSASEELREFETKLKSKPLSGLDFSEWERQKELHSTLQRVFQKEKQMNENLQNEQRGVLLKYGDVVQLMHVQSGHFLSCAEHGVSLSEPENFRVHLVTPASMLSWFTIQPAKAFVNGAEDPVYNGAEVYFSITVREDEFLHLATVGFNEPNLLKREAEDNRFNGHMKHEVNASLDKTAWKLCLFSTFDQGHDQIFVGDVVCVREPEDQTCLLVDEGEKIRFSKFSKLSEGDDDVHVHAAAYFVVEKHQRKAGGAMRWEEPVALRHLKSGNFLQWETSELVCVGNAKDPKNANDRRHYFLDFIPVQAQDEFVRAGTALKVGCGETAGGRLLTIKAGQVEMRDGSGSKASDEATALLIEKIPRTDRIELLQGLCALPRLKIMVKDLRQLEFDVDQFPLKVLSTIELLDSLDSFVCANGTQDEANSHLVITIPRRQQLLQEQGVIKEILDIIQLIEKLQKGLKVATAPIHNTNDAAPDLELEKENDAEEEEEEGEEEEMEEEEEEEEKDIFDHEFQESETKSGQVSGRSSNALDNVELGMLLYELGNACFRTLRVLLIKAPSNQLFVSERFQILLASVDQGEIALNCITEMLENNRDIQDNKVSGEEIDLFISMLRRTKLNAMVLNMLGAFCSCQGSAVKKNQCMVAEKMLVDNRDVLVAVQSDQQVCDPTAQHNQLTCRQHFSQIKIHPYSYFFVFVFPSPKTTPYSIKLGVLISRSARRTSQGEVAQ
jgi:hypothetical protein